MPHTPDLYKYSSKEFFIRIDQVKSNSPSHDIRERQSKELSDSMHEPG